MWEVVMVMGKQQQNIFKTRLWKKQPFLEKQFVGIQL